MIDDKYKNIDIDMLKLDMELAKNGYILQFWRNRIIKLSKKKERLEKQLRGVIGQIRLDLQKNPTAHKFKTNSDNIEAFIDINEEVSELRDILITKQSSLREAYLYKDTFIERGETIKQLIKLFLSNYYAESSYDELSSFKDKADEVVQTKKAENTLNNALKKRKRFN